MSGPFPRSATRLLMLGSDDNALHTFEAQNIAFLWSYETNDNVTSSPALLGGHLYFASWDGHDYALGSDFGELNWQFETGGWVNASPVISADVLYVGSHDGFVYSLGAQNGEMLWSYETGGWIPEH